MLSPLTIKGNDFSQLPEIGQLELFDDSHDKQIRMRTILKYPEEEKIGDLSEDN